MTTGEVFQNLMLVLGGLALFIYGIDLMSNSLKSAAGNRLKVIIEKTTNARWKGILVGIALTVLIQSSSAVTVLIIGLVSVDLLSLRQAVAVIIGANIGTTITSILIGLPIASWGLWFVLIGVLLFFIFKRNVPRNVGRSIIGFGLLFIGLQFLAEGVLVVAKAQWAQDTMKYLGNPEVPGFWALGFGFSTAFTLIIQSSSAAVGIIQKLYAIGTPDNPTITLIGAIPMILGANLGTTITGIFASIRGNKNAKRVALVHVIYNLAAVVLIMPLIVPIGHLLQSIENAILVNNKMMTIAIIHVFVNIAAALVIVWLINPLVRFVTWVIKDIDHSDELSQVLDENILIGTPSVALTYVKSGIFIMSDKVFEYLQLLKSYQFENNSRSYELGMELEDIIDDYDKRLHNYMITLVQKNELSSYDSNRLSGYLDIISDLERIADHFTNILGFIQQRYEFNQEMHEQESIELHQFYKSIEEMIGKCLGSLARRDVNLALEVQDLEIQSDIMEKTFRHNYNERLKSGEVQFSASSNYLDILSNLERVADHLTNISETVVTIYQPDARREARSINIR